MVHETHSHSEAGALGGVLDLTAVGLGFGMVVGGLLTIGGVLNVPAWFGLAAVTAIIGAIVGSVWGKKRGY